MCYWNLTIRYERGGKLRLTGPCIVTGKQFSVIVSTNGAHNYFGGFKSAQEAFPGLPKEEREFLISGVSPEGWRQMFADDGETDALSGADLSESKPQPEHK